MIRLRRPTLLAAALGAAIAGADAPVSAQEDGGVRFVISGGPTFNDLEAGGTLWLGAASLEARPVELPLVLDASFRYMAYTAAEREHYPLAELSAQWEIGSGSVRPFLGAGGGFAWRVRPGETDWDPSAHATGGIRFRLGDALGLRAEARLRSLEPLADFTLGLSFG
ncbi:MAG: hypothetical protein PVF90_07190 [Gemmatimonadota bacterium]|jgi:hypothetical protein